jgi:very-short-patch-repair endonuclease
LDDSSHNREDRQKADADKNVALIGAGYKIIRWSAKSLPDIEVIRKTFHDLAIPFQ